MKNIYILTGPVQTGKTTRLRKWVTGKPNIDGMLQPISDGKRYLIDIRSGLTKQLCLDEFNDSSRIVTVGNHKFDRRVFEWARAELINALENKPAWLIVDEVGKLELKGEGLEPVVYDLIKSSKEFPVTKFLFVIRDSLLQSFFEYYNVNKEDVTFFEFTEE